MTGVLEWFRQHPAVFWWLAALSALMFVAGVVLVPFLAARIPDEYFASKHRAPMVSRGGSLAVRVTARILRNVLGLIVLALGLVLLFVPGQGILSILVGISLLDFPGKFQLQRWLISRPAVLRSINWIRRRANRNPLVVHGLTDVVASDGTVPVEDECK